MRYPWRVETELAQINQALREGLAKQQLSFHAGHIGGALPQIVGA
jgi:hypothetical protein